MGRMGEVKDDRLKVSTKSEMSSRTVHIWENNRLKEEVEVVEVLKI